MEIIIHYRRKVYELGSYQPHEGKAILDTIREAGQFFYYDNKNSIEIGHANVKEYWFTYSRGKKAVEILLEDI